MVAMMGIRYVNSRNGFHQGDILATWLFNICLQPLLEGITSIVDSYFERYPEKCDLKFVGFYIDDGNIIAERGLMVRIVKYLQEYGPSYGYHIKPSKGAYIMGKCCDGDDPSYQREALARHTGLNSSIFHIHPDDCHDDVDTPRSEYGVKILGSYVGSDEYILNQLQNYSDELRSVAQNLIAYPNYQSRMLLFRQSFLLKPLHLFRSIRPSLLKEFLVSFESMKKQILYSLLECNEQGISDLEYELICLPISEGGLGLGDLSSTQ